MPYFIPAKSDPTVPDFGLGATANPNPSTGHTLYVEFPIVLGQEGKVYRIITAAGATHYLPGLEEADIAAYPVDEDTRNALRLAVERASYEELPGNVPPPPPDWDGFNAAMLGDPEFGAIYLAAQRSENAQAVLAANGLPAALLQVASGALRNFQTCFEGLCAGGGATPGQRQAWAELAETHGLPSSFIVIVRGQQNA